MNPQISSTALLRRLMVFIRPYRLRLGALLILALVTIGVTSLIPLLTGQAIDAIHSGSKSHLLETVLIIGVATLFGLGLGVVRQLVSSKLSLAIEFDLRQSFYQHLQRLELGFFDSQRTGQLMSRATVDLYAIRAFLSSGLISFTQTLLTLLLAGVVMFAIDPLLALIALIPAPFAICTAIRFSRLARPAAQETQQRIAELTAEAEENVSGIRIIKAFAREQRQLHRFRHAVNKVFDQSIYVTRLGVFFSYLSRILSQLSVALVLLVGGQFVIAGRLSLGDFSAFYLYLGMLLGPLMGMGSMFSMAQRAIASAIRMFEVVDREPAIQSLPGAPTLPPGGGEVELRGVTLCYGEGEPALCAVDFCVEAESTVALVGPSGSGKTSVAALVARLYDPNEGVVLIDKVDVRKVDIGSLRSQVVFVGDDSFLFSTSVAENITYARADASMEEIEVAAQRAQAHDFVSELPQGYQTPVGERGLTLSGGQRQRIAIARALLTEPRILILDDATSSVDATTEGEIKAGLQEAMVGRTTFIIAHRLSTIALADVIIVLDGGCVIDQGTHDELMARCAFYREIAEHGLADSVFLQRDLVEREQMVHL